MTKISKVSILYSQQWQQLAINFADRWFITHNSLILTVYSKKVS